MSLKDVFKENVKYYRKQLKLTQESLAKLSGVSTNYIGEIERTGRKATLETIEKVANGLNIDPSLLLVSRKKGNLKSGPPPPKNKQNIKNKTF